MRANGEKRVTLGRISGAYGTKGWVKIRSYTERRGDIGRFDDWILEKRDFQRRVAVEASKLHGQDVVAKLGGIDDREAARELAGATVMVERAALPVCAPGQYYWTDLEGMSVRTAAGEELGTIDHLLAMPAHDVIVLAGAKARMIPFAVGTIVKRIDLDAGVVTVEWERSFWD
ncbi:MAG TPA: ribosome maturation factor RimM [Gammaproteobacteria bacterium]